CGTGYTGEDGVEILTAPEHAVGVWDALTELGAQPIGLAARDTLRLEVCFHLYGNDLALERNPIEAGLGWCCALDIGFVGSEALAAVKAAGPKQKLVSFVFDDKGIPRQGNPVLVGGQKVGQVTSGTLSPSLDIGIGMAYINTEHSEVGTAIEVDVRGKLRSARIAAKPLYKKA
ncbi:MAG: hypothetical protein JHC87_06840, partial [Thermoleophilaceae bacterium]|nr:hypothetical protein [Thermoleophilaceae bacterium]